MKLTSLRDIDRVHLADLLGAGLIDALPPDLLTRLNDLAPTDDPL